ncbi:MAG TPA: prenyltransferase [Pseudonocardiaceae bacterium]|jgi:1,4-dihydroxy-2-naphthoate octaprenyltransferase
MEQRLLAFVRLSRPRFLVESLITATLGVTVAAYGGHRFQFGTWLLVQAFVTLTHLMTQYCNEYFDLEADSAHTAPNRWTGGSQILVSGVLRPVVSLSAAFVLLFLDVLLATLMPTISSRLIAFAILVLAWFYTAPPVRLNYRALGEITTAGVLTLLCPLLMSYTLLGSVSPVLPAVCVPLFLVMTARMLVMNFCDRDSDLLAGKHTLPNTLGPRRAALVFAGLQAAAYVIVVAVTVLGILPLPVGLGLMLTAPMAYLMSRRVLRDPPSPDEPDRAIMTAHMVTLHAASTGLVAVAGMIVAAALARGMTTSTLACVTLMLLYVGLAGGVQVRDVVGVKVAA